MPASRAVSARVSRVHCAGLRSSSADSSPAASRASCPGGAERVTEPVEAGRVEPVQPAAHRVLMTADPGSDRRDSQPVPAQRHDPGPLAPVRRSMPGTRKLADLPGLAVIQRRARPHELRHGTRLHTPVPRSPYPYLKLTIQKGT